MIPILFPLLLLGAAAYLYKKANAPISPGTTPLPVNNTPADATGVPLELVGGVVIPSDAYMFTGPDDDISSWPIVTLGSDAYRVAPSYIGPVGIGQAQQIAMSRGFQLPTPALVDAIWRAADLKLPPIPEASDGTPKTMSVPAVYLKHKQKILAQIAGRPFQLLGGTHKDIVVADTAQPGLKTGGIGLYGWHSATNANIGGVPVHAPVTAGDGFVIQQPFGGHGLDWIDYSQGIRLVKKVTGTV